MWKSVSCETQGIGHIKTNIPCQDKTMTLLLNGVSVIALADGAGSAKFSHFGAECVVNSIVYFLSENIVDLLEQEDGKQVKRQILGIIINALEREAAKRECKLNDLASTLLAVAIFEDKYLIVHIGDGVIGYLDGEQLKIASLPENGDFANVTTFVTSKEAIASMRLFKGKVNAIAGFVIMSDGTEQSFYHKQTKSLARATIKLLHRTCLLSTEIMEKQLLTTFNAVVAKHTQDDCSIALLARPIGILRDYINLNISEKCDVLGLVIQERNVNKRISWFDDVINFLETSRDLRSISKHMCLKPKYTRKRLAKLVASGLVTRHGSLYVASD